MRLTSFCGMCLTLLAFPCTDTATVPVAVCQAWPTGAQAPRPARALNHAVDAFARTLDPRQPMRNNARAVARWLAQQPCIRQVGIADDAVATEPPGLDLTVIHRNGSQRTFSLLFGKDHVKLSNSY